MSSSALHQNGNCATDIPVKECEASAETNGEVFGIFGEPDILPRLGDEYQVKLPPLIGEHNLTSYAEVEHHSIQNFCVGLAIPLVWIDCGKNVIGVGTSCNGVFDPSRDSVKSDEKRRMCIDEGRLLVPGSITENWGDADKASFLLALYIFEKNFVEVKRFVGSKDMGAILSFYYGEFYGSDAYRRWSEGRKTRSKKCVYGQRIFSGLRQQEFLSRLFPRVSEECKSSLLEVSKAFADDKLPLVEYVSSLRAMVGTNLVVEAVALGSGKQDLTGMALETHRSNHVARSEIPAGKACSALTTAEIIKFLSGDYRLSKARSNDLFWEAVWPRLLARGWHSEQPQNQGYIAGSKCLVFLLPGVKKFSRRKLVKGDHYFDSVTDVLSKVAKDPGLIELDDEEANGDQNTEKDEWSSDVKMKEDENHPPSRQRHSYLQPRTPNRSVEVIKFTVVDTGLSYGNIRELRTLPKEHSSMLISLDPEFDTMISGTFDVSAAETQRGKSGPKKHASRKNRDDGTSSRDIHPIHDDIDRPSASLKKKKDSDDNKKPRKVSKPVPRKQKQGYVDNVAPISKRFKKSAASTHEEEACDGVLLHPHSSSTAPRLENGVSCSSSHVHESNETVQVSSWQDKMSSASSSRGSPSESTDFPQMSSVLAAEPSHENQPQPQLLIDLNLPHVPLENDNNGPASNLPNEADNHNSAASTAVEGSSELQSNVNTRRLSTRYRPPTTRALEAVAGGYLSISRRRKGRDTSSLDAQPPRPSQQPRVGPGPNESPSSSVASPSQIGEASTSASASASASSQIVEADRNGASTSGTSKTDNKNDNPPESNQEEPPPRQ